MNEEFPLAVEIPFKIKLDDVLYVGRIDEIRNGTNGSLVIRDHKYKPWAVPKEMEREFNSQFTLYNLALTADLRKMGEMTRALKISEDRAKTIAGEQITSDKILLEYHLFKQDTIIQAERKLEHYFDLKDTIQGLIDRLENAYATGNFHAERGRNCDFCLHKDRCHSDTLENIATVIPVQTELFQIDLRFKKRSKGNKQISLRFPRKIS